MACYSVSLFLLLFYLGLFTLISGPVGVSCLTCRCNSTDPGTKQEYCGKNDTCVVAPGGRCWTIILRDREDGPVTLRTDRCSDPAEQGMLPVMRPMMCNNYYGPQQKLLRCHRCCKTELCNEGPFRFNGTSRTHLCSATEGSGGWIGPTGRPAGPIRGEREIELGGQSNDWLIDWFYGLVWWLVDWLIDWLIDWLWFDCFRLTGVTGGCFCEILRWCKPANYSYYDWLNDYHTRKFPWKISPWKEVGSRKPADLPVYIQWIHLWTNTFGQALSSHIPTTPSLIPSNHPPEIYHNTCKNYKNPEKFQNRRANSFGTAVSWLIDWLIGYTWNVTGLISWLNDWLIDWVYLKCHGTDKLIEWLIDWLMYSTRVRGDTGFAFVIFDCLFLIGPAGNHEPLQGPALYLVIGASLVAGILFVTVIAAFWCVRRRNALSGKKAALKDEGARLLEEGKPESNHHTLLGEYTTSGSGSGKISSTKALSSHPLVDCSSNRLIDWLIDLLINQSIDWLIDSFIYCSIDWLIRWFTVPLIDWLIDVLNGMGWSFVGGSSWLFDLFFSVFVAGFCITEFCSRHF